MGERTARRPERRAWPALRRALRSPNRALRGVVVLTGLVVLGWLAVTLGWALATGTLPQALIDAVPALNALSPVRAGLALFVPGALAITVVAFLLSALVYGRGAARQV